MKILRPSSLLCLLCMALLLPTSNAQQLTHVPGDLLIQFKPGYGPKDLSIASLRGNQQMAASIAHQKQVIPKFPIHLYRFDANLWHEEQVLRQIEQHPAVEFVQFNHVTQLRDVIPNDESFTDQWQYINDNGIDLDAEKAWEFTTGGTTPLGDEIVICVIDEGFDAVHPDLAPNVWVNRFEIPDNGIDEDNNGYIDDYNGWNTYSSDDSVNIFGNHGTAVAGIVGAKGNNGIGVTGVNWDVKLMLVVGGTGREDEALEAYGMALSHRKLYQETNGQRGAFVVATNASWGVDFLFAEDAPIWCAFYDSLGQYGILNAGATSNRNVNVDLRGDMPTTCPSEFLISVTNVDSTGEKLNAAGYGKQSIDLGAFGHQVYTIGNDGRYGLFFGTSGAAPHVAGAIGLLYAADCEELNILARVDPPAAARMVREQILLGTLGSATLDTTTSTGGRLNLLTSMQLLLDQCGNCIAPVNLESSVDITSVSLSWTALSATESVDLFYRKEGDADFIEVPDIQLPHTLANLETCTSYQYYLVANCGGPGLNSDTLSFTTDCETATAGVQVSQTVSVFPNPTASDLIVQTQAPTDLRIYNTQGQLLRVLKRVNGEEIIPLQDSPSGVYFLEFEREQQRWTEKIIKL